MFESIVYKKKVLLGGLLFVLLVLGAYKKNGKKILDIDKQLAIIEASDGSAVSEADILVLKKEIESIENVIGGVDIRPEVVQQRLLKFVSKSPYKIELVEIEGIHTSQNEEFIIYTNRLRLQGDYRALMQFTRAIEETFELSKISSVRFETVTDVRRRKKELFLNLVFQNYEKK